MSNPIAIDKAARFPDRILALRQGVQPAPIQVLLSISDLCDHACDWCSFRNEDLPTSELFPMVKGQPNPSRQMEFNTVSSLLYTLKEMGVHAVEFTGGGEPTIHPRLIDILHRATTAGLAVGLVTNGGKPQTLEDAAVELRKTTWVRVSVDAGTRETYGRLRGIRPERFDDVWKSVEILSGLDGPTVGVSFIVQEENWGEIERCAMLAQRHGAHNFRLSPIIHADGEKHFDAWGWAAANECRRMADMFRGSVMEVFDQFSTRLETLYHPSEKRCSYQHLAPFVGADLNVYRCCNTAFTSAGLLGSIRDRSFSDLWYDPATHASMLDLDGTKCPFCIFTAKNEFINRLTQKPSGHDLFV